jgi:hypothetical protein
MEELPVGHNSFTTVVLVNLVIFLVFFSSLYSLILNSSGSWQGLGVVAYVYMLVGFLAFTSYFYYEFLNHKDPLQPRYFTKLMFLLNILAPALLVLYLLNAMNQQ